MGFANGFQKKIGWCVDELAVKNPTAADPPGI